MPSKNCHGARFYQSQHQKNLTIKSPLTSPVEPIVEKVSLTIEKEKYNGTEINAQKLNVAVTVSSSEAVVTLRPESSATPVPTFSYDSKQWASIDWSNCKNISCNNTDKSSTALSQLLNHLCTPTSSLMKTRPSQVLSLSLDSLVVDKSTANLMPTYYRSNHRLFPVGTFAEPVQYVHHPKPQYSTGLQKIPPTLNSQNSSEMGCTSPKMLTKLKHSTSTPSYSSPPTCQSMVALINNFAHSTSEVECINSQQQPQMLSHLDFNENQHLLNPPLKSLQKGAVQLYSGRQSEQQQHQQQEKESNFEGLLNQSLRNSPSTLSTNENIGQAFLRNSLLHNYVTLDNTLTENTISCLNSSLPSTQNKPSSLVPPPPPPRSRIIVDKSNVTTLLKRSPSSILYAKRRDQYKSTNQDKLQSPSIKNISQTEKKSFNKCGVPPPPPPRNNRMTFAIPLRSTFLASDYRGTLDKSPLPQATALTQQQLRLSEHETLISLHHQTFTNENVQHYQHYHSNLNHHNQQNFTLPGKNNLIGLNNVGNNWAPERPPKNSSLRVPSPALPPPPALEGSNSYFSDEPLPPPPQEIFDCTQPTVKYVLPNRCNSFANFSLCEPHNMKGNDLSSEPKASTASFMVPLKSKSTNISPMSHSVESSITQIPKYQQSEIQRATIITFSTKTHPHSTLANSSVASPVIQESSALVSLMPFASSKCNHNSSNIRTTSPPPPLMPRILITTENAFSYGNPVNNYKAKCNSMAAYSPGQSLDKADNPNSNYASCKINLNMNEELAFDNVGDTKTKTNITSYNTLAAAVQKQQQHQHQHTNDLNLPNKFSGALPLDVKLQPSLTQSNISLLSDDSSAQLLYYGSNKSLTGYKSHNKNNISQIYHSLEQPRQQQQQQISRYCIPSLRTFNLTRYQSLDKTFEMEIATTTAATIANGNNSNNDFLNSDKYVSQLLMDFKKNLKALVEEQQQQQLDHYPGKIEEECNNTLVNKFNHNTTSGSSYSNEPRLCKAEQINTTLPSSPHTIKKPAILRQGPLLENIEKNTQLQSQLMSARTQNNNLLGISNCNSVTSVTSIGDSNGPGSGITNDTAAKTGCYKISPTAMKSSSDHIELLQNHHDPLEQLENDKFEDKYNNNNRKEQKGGHNGEEEITKPDPQECKESKEEKNILSQLDDNIDSLKLLQRSELRVNPSTVVVASHTDDNDADTNFNINKDGTEGSTTTLPSSSTILMPRQKHIIELDCEKLAEELVTLLPPDNRLLHLLRPKGSKTITDYVSHLYNAHIPYRPGKRHVSTSTTTRFYDKVQHDFDKLSVVGEKRRIVLYLGDMELNPEKYQNLNRKLHDFIKHLQIKARILAKEHIALVKESAINDELGKTLIEKLINHIKPLEASKCRSFISDMGHITDLLLALSERLAKTENHLNHGQFIDNITEKKMLENRRDSLYEKLYEAKRIKENIDRRGVIVFNVLEKQLSADDFADFLYFINMKVKLISDSHEITDNIKTGEELLNALSDIFR